MSEPTVEQQWNTPSRPANRPADEMSPPNDFIDYLRDYARAKPDVAALWCFGIGFVLGWKIKPW